MSAVEWQAPRCSHGHILLGCPQDDCPEQSAYLAHQQQQLDRWRHFLSEEARLLVREALGLEP